MVRRKGGVHGSEIAISTQTSFDSATWLNQNVGRHCTRILKRSSLDLAIWYCWRWSTQRDRCFTSLFKQGCFCQYLATQDELQIIRGIVLFPPRNIWSHVYIVCSSCSNDMCQTWPTKVILTRYRIDGPCEGKWRRRPKRIGRVTENPNGEPCFLCNENCIRCLL